MSSDQTTRQELTKCFKSAVADHEDVMNECLSILRVYNLSAQDLFFKYEAFLMARPSGLRAKLSKFTLDVARELRKEVQREQQGRAAAAAMSTPNEKAAGVRRKATGGVADLGGFLDNLATPVRKPKSSTVHPPSRLSNAGNNVNLPSPSFATPSRTPTGPTGSSYRPGAGAGPSRLAPPSVTPIGKGSGNGNAAPPPSSPISGSESPMVLGGAPTQPFHLRPQPHHLMETLNAHLSAGSGVPPGVAKSRVALSYTVDPKTFDYRYMFEKISARSEALDEQIDTFGQEIKDTYGLTELGDPSLPSDDDIYAVGRVLAPPTDTQKANAAALFLQSSRVLGAGKVVSLRFAPAPTLKVRGGAAGVRGFGLFPGCLVCVKGRNGGGGAFVVEEVLMPMPAEMPRSDPVELIENQQGEKLNGLPLSVYVAAGPYTLDDDLRYEPLDALMDVACDERPDALILLGPFVDSAHPHIQAGKISITPMELFREQVATRINRITEMSPATHVILIPSVRDLISAHAAYPQAMFDSAGLGLSKKVKLLPNPCTFNINEVVISLSSPDVLFHLRKEELFQRAEEAEPEHNGPVSANPQGDAMANLVRHVLGQRSMYPLFPPPEAHAAEVNLDVTHWNMARLDLAPDLLILPSKLKHFSKIVDSTLAVNPGHLSRAHSAGTFAKITIHPSKNVGDDADMDDGMVEHRVDERARSEVWRI